MITEGIRPAWVSCFKRKDEKPGEKGCKSIGVLLNGNKAKPRCFLIASQSKSLYIENQRGVGVGITG